MSDVSWHLGGCLCGAIRYRLSGPPFRAGICHCTQCRRQTGSPMAAFVAYRAAALELLAGSPALYRASALGTREFCAICGSTLFWRDSKDAEVDVFLGSLDRPEEMPVPSRQIWTAHRIPWMPAMPEIRAYHGSPHEG